MHQFLNYNMSIHRSDLTLNELMVLNSELRDQEKSLALAYLMLLGGHLGVHRFYLKKIGTAVVQLVLFLTASVTYFFGVVFMEFSLPLGIASLVIAALSGLALFVWIVVDLFIMPGMVREWNERVERQLIDQIVYYRNSQSLNN